MKSDAARTGTDLSGKQIGNFHFLRRLGRGAMAEVYLAEQTPLKRWVAVKILKPELANDPTYLKRFEREAQAAASLVHANIVQVYEVGHIDGLHFIVQEYVQGQNLRDWLARKGPPELRPALSIMRQIASALAKAAEHGVIHRDVKPENIMITNAGEVKVADFGLARVVRENDATATSLTQVGITMGTPLYMSPEQVEGRELDHRSDLYSFGVLCYHLLTGKPPFMGDTALAVAVQHVKKQPRSLEEQRPDLPAALCRIVHQMLAKEPDHRWQSCREVLRELYRVHLEFCPQATPEEVAGWDSTGLEPLTDPRLRAKRQLAAAMRSPELATRRRNRWLVAASMFAAFVLSGTAAWFTMRPQPLMAAPHNDELGIPRQPTVLRQWYYASQIGTEEAWRSVIEYFPTANEYYGLRAKQQLGRIYLRERDFERAIKVFEDLAGAPSSYAEFCAFGLAGKSGVLSLEGHYKESAEVMEKLWPRRQDLKDTQMDKMLEYVIKKNRKELGAQTSSQWNEWLTKEFKSEG